MAHEDISEMKADVKQLVADMSEVTTALRGYNGQVGLCRQVEKNSKAIFRLTIIMAIIAVSIGGGTYGIIDLLLRIPK